MSSRAKTWRERLRQSARPVVKTLDFDFAGLKRGTTMLVVSPLVIDAYIRALPFGEARLIARARAKTRTPGFLSADCADFRPMRRRIGAWAGLASDVAFRLAQIALNVDKSWKKMLHV